MTPSTCLLRLQVTGIQVPGLEDLLGQLVTPPEQIRARGPTWCPLLRLQLEKDLAVHGKIISFWNGLSLK